MKLNMKIPDELRGIRKRRCTRCVCPVKNHKRNVADGFGGDMDWGAFYDEDGKPDGWSCWKNNTRSCKGCYLVLKELISS